MKHFCSFKLLIWRQKWVDFLVRRVSPGSIIVVLFWTKYVDPGPITPRILRLTFRRGQGNYGFVFTFGSCDETGNFRVVSVGQLSYDWRSYRGLSRHMQGSGSVLWNWIPLDIRHLPSLNNFKTPFHEEDYNVFTKPFLHIVTTFRESIYMTRIRE